MRLKLILLSVVCPLLVLGAGGLVMAYLIWTKPQPPADSEGPSGRLVRAFAVVPRDHQIAMTAYGTSKAGREWKAIAEVGGRALQVHADFEPGRILRKGTVLVQLDRSKLELAKAQLDADIKARRLERQKLVRTKENNKRLLPRSKRQMDLAGTEYERLRKLLPTVAESAVEVAERAWLTLEVAHQQRVDVIELSDIEIERLDASIALVEVQLKEALRDLEKTTITLPFTGICSRQSVELEQFVAAGESLGSFVSIDRAEVEVMLEIRKGYMLWPRGELSLPFDPENPGTLALLKNIVIPATVRPVSHPKAEFSGRVSRALFTDPESRSAPVIIEVDRPFQNAQLGVRPPLTPNMFCQVTIYGQLLRDVFVVPRETLRDDRLYLVRDGKLHIQPVHVLVLQDELAVIDEGLNPGDLVVIGSLFPASAGMDLRVHEISNPASSVPAPVVGVPGR